MEINTQTPYSLQAGSVRAGARGYTAGAGTIAGYVNVVDDAGITRKLAVLA